MAVARRRRQVAAEVSLLSRTSTAAFLFLGVAFYGIGDTTGRHVPVTAVNSSLPDSLNESHSYSTSLTTDTPVPLPTTHGDTTTYTHGDTTTYTHGDTTTYTHGDTTTYNHGDTSVQHKVTLPVTTQTEADNLPTSSPQKVTTRHLSTTGGSSVDVDVGVGVGVGVDVSTQDLLREKQYLELATERLHDTEVDENVTRFNATISADHGHRGSELDNKTHSNMMTTTMRTKMTTVKTVSSTTVRGHRVTSSRKHLTKTVSRTRVHHPVAVTTVVPPPPQPQPTGYEDYFMPVNKEDWEAYTEEDHDDEPEDTNDTEDKSKTEDMKNKHKANTIQESDIFSMREDGFGPISDIEASKIEVKGPLISHSFLAENSMGLLVIYTWIVMVTVIAIVTMVIVKHKQQLVDALWERRFKTARTRRVDDTYEEEHNLLPYPQV